MKALDDFLDRYEADHGEITEEEIREATRRTRESALVVRGPHHDGGAPRLRKPGAA